MFSNKEYINLYNKSITNFIDNLTDRYSNLENDIKEKYLYSDKKNTTGYILFIKDMYKENKNIDKKTLSKKWKELNKVEKQKYLDKSKEINGKINKKNTKIDNKKKQKQKQKDNIINIFDYDKLLENNILYDIEIDNKKYIIDIFKNIIDIKTSKYIGYIKGDYIKLL